MRRYVDDVTFQVAKDSRDLLRAVQRDLRDHFTAQAEQLKRSLQESQQAAERAVKASRAEREARLTEIATELEQLERVRRQARALLPEAGAGDDRRRWRCELDDRSLTRHGRRVLLLAIDAHRDEPATARWLHVQLRRLDEPLRVAIAGKVKAGKSTLLNALVGEQVAPTDAGECTRVVTWYRDGATPRIVLHPRDGVRGRCRCAGTTAR